MPSLNELSYLVKRELEILERLNLLIEEALQQDVERFWGVEEVAHLFNVSKVEVAHDCYYLPHFGLGEFKWSEHQVREWGKQLSLHRKEWILMRGKQQEKIRREVAEKLGVKNGNN